MWKVAHCQKSDYVAQPWKNGLGETLEIAQDTEEPFRWRLSWAKIPMSCPFSLFPGYRRTLVLLRGGPVWLVHDGRKEKQLTPFQAYSFKGAWKTDVSVVTPAEDFNVFVLEDKARANVYPTHVGENEDIQFPVAGQEHFIFVVEGTIEVGDPNTDQTFILAKGETVRFSRTTEKEFLNLRAKGKSPSAACLWIVIHLT